MSKLAIKFKIFITRFFIKNLLYFFIPSNQTFIHHWREYFFNIVFFFIFLINSALFIVVLVYQIINQKLTIIILSLTIFLLNILIIYFKKIPYFIRSYLGCLIFYFIGLLIFYKIGPVSSGLLWFILFSIFTTSFNGLKGFFFSNLLIILTIFYFIFMIPVYNFNWVSLTKDFYTSKLWWLTGYSLIAINITSSFLVNFFMSHFEKVLIRNSDSKNAIIIGLASLAEYRDFDTGRHLERISKYTVALTKELKKNKKYKSYITEDYIDDISISSILHDIGKVGIEDKVLLKPGKLSVEEFNIIKLHPIIGSNVIENINKKVKDKSFLELAKQIILYHHEKFDGTGYPKGLKGEEIPLSARIVSLVDVYDALISKRIYKDEFSHEKAIEIIQNEKGKHFDPDIVDAFMNVNTKFIEIRKIFDPTINVLE